MFKKISLTICCLLFVSASAWAQQNHSDDSALKTNVSFKDIDAKEAIKNLAKNVSLSVQFDSEIKSKKVSFEIKQISLQQTIEVILVMQDWQAKQTGSGELIIFPNKPEKLEQYKQHPNWKASEAK